MDVGDEKSLDEGEPMKAPKKLYFHMTYSGRQGRTFATKFAAIRSASLFMKAVESEREFLMVVCREFGLAGRDGRPKDSVIWRPF